MELKHATNMLAYNAPDLYPQSAKSTTSSSKSDDDSDSAHTSTSSPPTSPDVPSAADRSTSPEPNHLSCYFTPPGHALPSNVSESAVPKIPQRAPSHTKKASYEAAFKNSRYSSQSSHSASTKASTTLSRSSSSSTAATSFSAGSLSRKPSIPSMPTVHVTPSPPVTRSNPNLRKTAERSDPHHPFGQELAQVSEIAEHYGVKATVDIMEQEEQDLVSRGLCRLRAEDYLAEIHDLFSTFFQPPLVESQQPVWI
jgi:hypothetical protein